MKGSLKMKRGSQGFTLVELMIVVSLLALMISAVVSAFDQQTSSRLLGTWTYALKSLSKLPASIGVERVTRLSSETGLTITSPSRLVIPKSNMEYAFDLNGESAALSKLAETCPSVQKETEDAVVCLWNSEKAALTVSVKTSFSGNVYVAPDEPPQSDVEKVAVSETSRELAMKELLVSYSLLVNRRNEESKVRWLSAKDDFVVKFQGAVVSEPSKNTLMIRIPSGYSSKMKSVCATLEERCEMVGEGSFRVKVRHRVDGWDAEGGLE